MTFKAFISGLLLPFRLYFQPITLFNSARQQGTRENPNPPMLLVYLWSLIWLPITFLLATLLYGWPTRNDPSLILTMPVLMVVLGGFMGLQHLYINQQWAGLAFDWSVAVALGLVFNVGIILNLFMLDDIAETHNMEIAAVVDSPTLDMPSQVVLGFALGLTLAMVIPNRAGIKRYLQFSIPLSIGLVILMATISRPDLRTPNTLVFALAALLITHLGFQPLWWLLDFTGGLLVRINPAWSKGVWRLSPANWNEFSYIPLPNTYSLVKTLYQQDSKTGLDAIRRLKQHPFYGKQGQRLLKEIYGGA